MRKTRLLIGKTFERAAKFLAENELRPFPIKDGFRGYDGKSFHADLRAGINVALLGFPQGMAYAAIAELPIQYGIVSAAIAAIVAPLFAGSRHTILGPTNATAFMVFSSMAMFSDPERLRLMPMIVLLIGLLLVVGALFRVADLIQYISRSVVVGYITAAAILIIANQIKHALGIVIPMEVMESVPVPGVAMPMDVGDPVSSRTFLTIVQDTFSHLNTVHWQAVALSVITAVVWVVLSKTQRRLPVFATTLVVMCGVYYVLHAVSPWAWMVQTFDPFTLSDLMPRLPEVGRRGLVHDLSSVFGIAFSVAFLAALENSVMSRTLASRSGDRPDMNQDMFSVGMANLACAFTGGMPSSGSPVRSTLNFTSGAVSRLSSIISGVLCAVCLVLLASHMDLVPKSVLAVLVMCVAISLINRRNIRICLMATSSDAAVLLTTFVSALLMPLNVAIFFGVGVSIMLYLRKASQPYLTEYEFSEGGELREAGEKRQRPIPAISIVHVEGELFFGAAELFRTQIQKICLDPDLRVIILRLKNARHLDATSVMALVELVRYVRSAGRELIISGASKDVYRVLKNADMVEVIGRNNIFLNSPRNPNLSTRNALKRAQEVLGTTEANIRIFYDPNKDANQGG
ncbi:MAG: SulP family inorganic anion transporter [Verrucomicrobiae bacterium]|nr:SulP family inorganic anion transporter [Verrucomicrobiae bacterium]